MTRDELRDKAITEWLVELHGHLCGVPFALSEINRIVDAYLTDVLERKAQAIEAIPFSYPSGNDRHPWNVRADAARIVREGGGSDG